MLAPLVLAKIWTQTNGALLRHFHHPYCSAWRGVCLIFQLVCLFLFQTHFKTAAQAQMVRSKLVNSPTKLDVLILDGQCISGHYLWLLKVPLLKHFFYFYGFWQTVGWPVLVLLKKNIVITLINPFVLFCEYF